jgi:transcription elongation factor Elf1
MIRTTRNVYEVKCKGCGIISLLGQTVNGQKCCDNYTPEWLDTMREIVEYKKTNEEESDEAYRDMMRP